VAAPSGIGPVSLSACGDPQRLKQLGDELLDATVALSTTRDAVVRLLEGYTQSVLKSDVGQDEDDIRCRLDEHLREIDWLLQQTEGLRQKLIGTSQLVRCTLFSYQRNADVSSRYQASWPSAMGTH
jgi:hypothetical protein